MTRDDDFIGQLEGYLDDYEGSTTLPESVRDAIRAQLPSIRQRPAWWPARRFPEMNNTVRIALAAAVVAVAAMLGFSYLIGPNVGGPGPNASPSPTPTPPLMSGDALAPGTYRLTAESEPFADVVDFPDGATITVPDGWANRGGFRVTKNADGPEFTNVAFWVWPGDLSHVYEDPCQWQDSEIVPPVGPAVDDLADALATQAQRGDAVPVDVSIDGYRGKMIELTVPGDMDFATCDGGEFRSWMGRYHQGPGQVDQVYILDVEGQRIVLYRSYLPGTSDADRAEGQAIVESIQLDGF